MNQNSELMDIISGNFGWNKARVRCFVNMLIALLITGTVNLTKIARAMPGNAKQESRYRQITRFFANYGIDFDVIALFIFKLFFVHGGMWYLTMDRTNWQWGESDINILTLAIVFKGIAIPIYWELLDKRGNSDTKERIAIVQKFIDQFGKNCIAAILADREFIGNDWFNWLKANSISFVIRVKKNLLTTDSRGRTVSVSTLFRGLKPSEQRVLYGTRMLMGEEVYLSALWLPGGELLVVATDHDPGNSIKTYGFRWQIETLFSCLKGRGFNFEDTHISDPVRIKKLFVLLAIGFCWAHKTGEWRHEQKAIKIKTHGRPAFSLFRYGLDYLVDVLLHLFQKNDLFKFCLDSIKPIKSNLNLIGSFV
jgi:hypothetical protein